MESAPGALHLRILLSICWMVPGDVKQRGDEDERWEWVKVSNSVKTLSVVGLHCCSYVSANSSDLSSFLYERPFGPISGWTAGVLFSSFLFSLKIESSWASRMPRKRSHSSTRWVLRIKRMNLILLLIRRLTKRSRKLSHSLRNRFLEAIFSMISRGRVFLYVRLFFMYELLLTAVIIFVLKWATSASISWSVLIGGFNDGDREPIIVMYLAQLTLLVATGGEEVIGESDSVSSTELWSEDSSLRLFVSYESWGRWFVLCLAHQVCNQRYLGTTPHFLLRTYHHDKVISYN